MGTLSPIVEQVANRMITVSFALLLGLRLLFCSSWKIIWSFQFYLPKKIRRFVLVSVCSSNRRKAAGTLQAILLARSNKILGKKSVYFYSSFQFDEIYLDKNLLRKNSTWKKISGIVLRKIVRGKLSGKLVVNLSWKICGRFVLRENCSWKNCRK